MDKIGVNINFILVLNLIEPFSGWMSIAGTNFDYFFVIFIFFYPAGVGIFSLGTMGSLIYDAQITNPGDHKCIGETCFRWAFIIISCLCGVGCFTSFWLMVKTNPRKYLAETLTGGASNSFGNTKWEVVANTHEDDEEEEEQSTNEGNNGTPLHYDTKL